jgi:competence ComEA-like helix-hairpin-helix protein
MSVLSPESPVAIDLGPVAKALNLAVERVAGVVKLLDEGNTIPFITRYRKDQTGGLDEEPIRAIHDRVSKQRQLAERKQTILRSIESQGKLTPDLARAIEHAATSRRLEDLYLPYKPKKQTLATTARSRGLEPLALEILNADPLAADLDLRLKDFVNTDKQVPTAADALLGAGHILAELFSERADFRGRIRAVLEKSGRLVTTSTEPEPKPEEKPAREPRGEKKDESSEAKSAADEAAERPLFAGLVDEPADAPTLPAAQDPTPAEATPAEATTAVAAPEVPAGDLADTITNTASEDTATDNTATEDTATTDAESTDGATDSAAESAVAEGSAESAEPTDAPAPPAEAATDVTAGEAAEASTSAADAGPDSIAAPAVASTATAERKKKEKKKKKPLSKAERRAAELKRAFRDYFQFSEAISRVPPHRVLAINRGEKAKILRVRVEADHGAMERIVDELLVPAGHPHADFLRGCGRDALERLVLPSLEREVRREITDEAETHAVEVFAKNLRNLLLQPPVRERRLLALDPGFKSGCKWVALDEFGNLLEHGVVFVVGNAQRRTESKAKLAEVVKNHGLSVIVIGNGTACRETETMVADLLGAELAGSGVSYVIVSEAGASVYSASPLGREEFPDQDATVRGAVSIGRRLQDPLSELVKIEPNSLGVGLYQHDVKGKHLRDSLDAVVESCVNYVGVDLNTASPSLLRYVSGLNQLTAQRIYDHRKEHGPFKTREQLKEVSGVGEAAFVQAAGFLKITGGDNPLDLTWIHPESYDAANRLLESLHAAPIDLADKEKAAKLSEKARGIDLQRTALQLKIGTLTLNDMLAQITRPGRDPRDALPAPIFKQGILKLDDLQPGMELRGTVLNVVDFGAFVDIGLKDSGLVHISHMAGKYVKDPHEVVSVGDIVKVWVLSVDKARRRVSLTMIAPGSKREEEPRRDGHGEGGRDARGGARGGQDRGPQGRGGDRGGAGRPAGGGRFGGQGGQGGSGGQGGPGGGGGRPGGGPGRGGPGGRGGAGGGRFGGGGGKRFDRRDRRDEAPETPEVAPEPVKPAKPVEPPKKLSKAKLQGRAYLQSFGELTQFLAPPPKDPPPAAEKPAGAANQPSAAGPAAEQAPAVEKTPSADAPPSAGETPESNS